MDFEAGDYYRAALGRLEEAREALDPARRRHGQTLWIAGVAVECILRAFRLRANPEFDARHDIVELFRQSGLWDLLEKDLRRPRRGKSTDEAAIRRRLNELRADINAVGRLWHNNYRYASEDRLKRHLRTAGLHAGIKGDYLKENARKVVDAAGRIVEEGRRLWGRS